MARQTPQQRRANEAFSKHNEKNMGRTIKPKKEVAKSPVSTPVLILLIFVVIGTMGIGFGELGGALYGAVLDLLRKVGILSQPASPFSFEG